MVVSAAARQIGAPYFADRIIVDVMTGRRPSELLGLEWSRVDLEANTIRLDASHTKARNARWMAVSQVAREVVRRCRELQVLDSAATISPSTSSAVALSR